jgi:hypothetical protein
MKSKIDFCRILGKEYKKYVEQNVQNSKFSRMQRERERK